MTKKALTRQSNYDKRNARIKAGFEKRYIHQPKVNGARIYTRAYIISELAEEFCLSMSTIENILYK